MHRSWNGLSRWADKRLPGLLLLAFLVLLSQIDSARATDIELAPASADAGLSLATLGFVCAAPLSALAALLYGLCRARRPVNFRDVDRQGPRTTKEYRPMKLAGPVAALLSGGRASVSHHACRAVAPAAPARPARADESFLAGLPR